MLAISFFLEIQPSESSETSLATANLIKSGLRDEKLKVYSKLVLVIKQTLITVTESEASKTHSSRS